MIAKYSTKARDLRNGPILVLSVAFFTICTWASYARWANFEYRTFDLAYYVQSIWQFIHGRFDVSVEGVPLLGNHVEPIILAVAPFFLVFRHPLIFVFLQNAALASMGPVAFRIAERLGLDQKTALLVGGAILITPATGYIALHEFHPEAFAAPLILLAIHARLSGSLCAHWCWLIALLACKENMGLLVTTYCAVYIVRERRRPLRELLAWEIWPMALSILWFVISVKFITPALNAGNIDYLALYDRLGTSGKDILFKAVTEPHRIGEALRESLSHGNLFWALIIPFLALPILSPRWLLIAAPIFLQHLLSWRSSEWTIYFHYAAPLVPLLWIALAEAITRINRWTFVPPPLQVCLPWAVIVGCIASQIFLGPLGSIVATTNSWFSGKEARERKQAFVDRIPPDASVVAPLPYLSHLAMRQKLYSLHYVLKGLKTLSRSRYSPPAPTDFVLIDYADSATFDAAGGYYHPKMKTVGGLLVPSSDQLLHEFLHRSQWTNYASNELTLLQQETRGQDLPSLDLVGIAKLSESSTLLAISKSATELTMQGIEINMSWNFQEPRDVFPWMFLKLISPDHARQVIIPRGLCAPEATEGQYQEKWRLTPLERIAEGEYEAEAVFVDNTKRAWAASLGPADSAILSPPISLGRITVAPRNGRPTRD